MEICSVTSHTAFARTGAPTVASRKAASRANDVPQRGAPPRDKRVISIGGGCPVRPRAKGARLPVRRPNRTVKERRRNIPTRRTKSWMGQLKHSRTGLSRQRDFVVQRPGTSDRCPSDRGNGRALLPRFLPWDLLKESGTLVAGK